MTAGVNLGLKPDRLGIYLTKGADFFCTLRLNTTWPTGTTLTIAMPSVSVTWTATISGTDATFNVANSVADTIPDGTPAKLVYVNGSTDQVWAIGKVTRTDG